MDLSASRLSMFFFAWVSLGHTFRLDARKTNSAHAHHASQLQPPAPAVEATPVASMSPPQLSVGQDVEMFSSDLNAWLPSKVTAMHSDGRVDVETKIHKSVQASEISRALRIPASQPHTSNHINVKFQSGKTMCDDAWQPFQVSLGWKVKDLIAHAGLSQDTINVSRSRNPGAPGQLGDFRGRCTLQVWDLGDPVASLDLDDAASWVIPVSDLNLSDGCELHVSYM